jgi:hypothetical protein
MGGVLAVQMQRGSRELFGHQIEGVQESVDAFHRLDGSGEDDAAGFSIAIGKRMKGIRVNAVVNNLDRARPGLGQGVQYWGLFCEELAHCHQGVRSPQRQILGECDEQATP